MYILFLYFVFIRLYILPLSVINDGNSRKITWKRDGFSFTAYAEVCFRGLNIFPGMPLTAVANSCVNECLAGWLVERTSSEVRQKSRLWSINLRILTAIYVQVDITTPLARSRGVSLSVTWSFADTRMSLVSADRKVVISATRAAPLITWLTPCPCCPK